MYNEDAVCFAYTFFMYLFLRIPFLTRFLSEQ